MTAVLKQPITEPIHTNALGLPFLGFGMGLRSQHYGHILEHKPAIDWFEIISENYMGVDGKPKRILSEIRTHYPIVMHGVSLSIGSDDPLNITYLKELKALANWLQPQWISDHLCWTGAHSQNTHDLLPVPYTEEALRHVVARIKQVQDLLERPLILENPSTYLEFQASHMPEAEFIARMAEESNCGLLLDVNNIYVTCFNHRLDPKAYIDALPLDRVVQIHLAGHEHMGTHIVDTHEGRVIEPVWQLYRYVISKTGQISTMIEWDANVPAFEAVFSEVAQAKDFAREAFGTTPNALPQFLDNSPATDKHNQPLTYGAMLSTMHQAIVSGDSDNAQPSVWIREKSEFPADAQLNVYIKGYRLRLYDATETEYPLLSKALGGTQIHQLLRAFVEETPSTFYSIDHYVYLLPDYIKKHGIALLAELQPFAYELALVEATISELFFMPDSEALSPADLQHISPDNFLSLQLPLRQATRLFALSYPLDEYMKTADEEENSTVPTPTPSWLAVYRNGEDIWRLALEEEEYHMLSLLHAGETIEATIEQLHQQSGLSEEALIGNLQRWFGRWMGEELLAKPLTLS